MSDKADPNIEPKGFAGLESLVSNVDKDIARAERARASKPAKEGAPKVEGPNEAESEGTSRADSSAKWPAGSEPKGNPGIGWVVAIAVGVLISIWVGSTRNDDKQAAIAPAPSSVSAPSQPEQVPTRKSEELLGESEARWVEEEPPVGTGRVLGYEQLRYCVAEEMRLGAMESMLDSHAKADINGFNAYVDDYNSRCSDFQYKTGSLESVRRQAVNWRASFKAQGQLRVEEWRSGGRSR